MSYISNADTRLFEAVLRLESISGAVLIRRYSSRERCAHKPDVVESLRNTGTAWGVKLGHRAHEFIAGDLSTAILEALGDREC